MVPLGGVFQRLPRVVRDVAASRGKRVALHVSGQETEVDKTVADALVDPLVHLVRNAVDHGIEPPEVRRQAEKAEEGELRVEAFREGSSVVIEVRDDGAGIDPQRVREAAVTKGIVDSGAAARLSDEEALELIFTAGLSTAAEVSDISGRGVGMDVVRSNVVRVGGSVSVTSRPGHGTAFRLKIPLTLSVFRALVVEAGGGTFAVPLESVRQTANVAPEKCKTLYGRPVIPVQGRLVGMVSLAETMGLDSQCRDGDAGGERPVAVVEAVGEMVGLVVDALDPPQEILVKPLDGFLSAGGIVSGATVMGNGRVALVLDPAGLLVAALAHARGGEASARQGVEGEVR
jgi:two-component system chemotaxis sensor kinase CheA